jgi:hypothetical protein
VQPYDLLAPLMQLLKGLVSGAFFFHARSTIKFIKSSNLFGLSQ